MLGWLPLSAALVVVCGVGLGHGQTAPASPCTFPTFLTRRPRWETRVSQERRLTEKLMQFRGSVMQEVNYGPGGSPQINRHCVMALGDNKFIVEEQVANGATKFMCIRARQISGHVAQLDWSQNTGDVAHSDLCADGMLRTDPWVLVWPNPTSADEGARCALSGGYEFYMTDGKSKANLCKNAWLKPRMESDCMSGEGINFDFREFECRGELGMELSAKLSCLGSWKRGNYMFTVVTDGDQFWPKLWMLRFPADAETLDSFTAHLASDMVMDTTEEYSSGGVVHRLHMHKAVYATLCENEASAKGCTDCNERTNRYCQKTCHRCDANRKQDNQCQLEESWKGEWMEISQWGQKEMLFTDTMAYIDTMVPLQCYDLDNESPMWNALNEPKTKRRAFVSFSKNGCKPRYTCAQVKRISASVLQYRLSQHLIWPHSHQLTPEEVCGNHRFHDDAPPVKNRYRSATYKFLVKALSSEGSHDGVECGIRGHFRMTDHSKPSCRGILSSCERPDHFEISGDNVEPNGGCAASLPAERSLYKCIGLHLDGPLHYIISEHVDHPNDKYHCWMIFRHENEEELTMFKMLPGDCNRLSQSKILYGNFTAHLGHYKVDTSESLQKDEICNKTPLGRTSHYPTTSGAPQFKWSHSNEPHLTTSKQPALPGVAWSTTPAWGSYFTSSSVGRSSIQPSRSSTGDSISRNSFPTKTAQAGVIMASTSGGACAVVSWFQFICALFALFSLRIMH